MSMYSFKILNLNLIMYSQSTGYIFLSELHEACKSIKLCTYIGGYTGLQDSSPEELKMHQNSLRPALRLGPHLGSSQRTHKPLSWWDGAVSPDPRTWPLAQPLGPDSIPRLAPAMLISLRRHCCLVALYG